MAGSERKGRPVHPKKDIEAVLREAESHGWIVSKGKTYYKALCTCPEKHMKLSIKLTPSDGRYVMNLSSWFRRQECWKENA